MLRFLTAGESHGKGLTVIIDGMPAGVPISADFIKTEMQKRMKGSGAGGRMMIETDAVDILSGVRFGKTIGSPISLYIENKDFKNWGEKMSSEPQSDEIVESAKVTNPRPGHTDLAGVLKYGLDDVRSVLERASARETTARVAAGAIFKQLLLCFGIEIASHTLQIGSIRLEKKDYTYDDVKKSYSVSPEIRCFDTVTAKKMDDEIMKARKEMNTLGGIVEIWAVNVPVGLGSYVQFDRKIDGQIGQALMSIQSVKAVEIGEGVAAAGMSGSDVHDEIHYSQEKSYHRFSNRAGGIEGGVTNGEPVVVRVYHKPISTLYKPLKSVDIATKESREATIERSDICIVPRGAVVSEAMLAYVLANNLLEKFGSDALEDIQASFNAYNKRLRSR
jgi:chorismate synthase